jgi:hypothetical protein
VCHKRVKCSLINCGETTLKPKKVDSIPGDENLNLKFLTGFVSFVAVYPLFTGYIYANQLYTKLLGISLNTLGIPIYQFIIYSFTVLMNSGKHLLVLLVIGINLILLLTIKRKEVVVLLFILPFPFLYNLAQCKSGHGCGFLFK